MHFPSALLPVASLLCLTASSLLAADPAATQILQKALTAQGGERKLRELRSIHWQAAGYRNQVEESERPEGPYITEFLTIDEVHDRQGERYRSVQERAVFPVEKSTMTTVLSGDIVMRSVERHDLPGTPQQVQLIRERLALSPERLLLTALDAPDIRLEADTLLQSVPQKVLAFTLDGAPVRVLLNAYTLLPTAVDYSGPLARSGFFAYGGDATMRTYYGYWWLAKGGVHLPLQWNVEVNGLADQMFVVKQLGLDEALDEAALTIPQEVRAQFHSDAPAFDLESRPLGDPKQPVQELAPGVVLIPGAWNVTLVRQEDGVVILEAPISSGYSARVIAEAHRRFPGEPIKAVVTTSDSWPHLAGIREYAAENIPIYALDLNRPILERFLAAPHTVKPDALQKSPRTPSFQLVSGKTLLGTGTNRLEVYPLRGETSERQMMIYFPEHRLLYGSDPFQRLPNAAWFYPQTVSELLDAVARERLVVDRFFMMHVGPTLWAELAPAVSAAARQNSPDGAL